MAEKNVSTMSSPNRLSIMVLNNVIPGLSIAKDNYMGVSTHVNSKMIDMTESQTSLGLFSG